MTDAGRTRRLLRRYLRQRQELGQSELVLDGWSAAEVLARLRTAYDPGGQVASPASDPGAGRATPEPGRSRESPANLSTGGLTSTSAARPAGSGEFDELRTEVLACRRCRLCEGRSRVVFGEGDPNADLVVVGEAPGFEEDRSGRPFVGPAGHLLDKMLVAIGFRRDAVFICNVLKCRPPNNRDPLVDEVAACRPYLRRQVELIDPKAICAFGRFAAQTLLASEASLSRLRGTIHDFLGVPVVVTYHPAALLRNAEWKRPAWEDLKLLRRVYEEAGGRAPVGESG